MFVLRPLLPKRYAPLRETGDGLQNIYLTLLPESLGAAIANLIGREAKEILLGGYIRDARQTQAALGLVQWEEHRLAEVNSDTSLTETVREAVVLARRGQGLFKQRVMRLERACRITRVDREEHLRASHCKPWRDSNNEERLDGENGLLLTPTADHLFDRGFISFDDKGDVLYSPVADQQSLIRMGLDPTRKTNVGSFAEGQRTYLEFHRENVLLRSKFLE